MAARIVVQQPKFSHVTPILEQLHWLPVHARVQYKVLLLLFKSVNNIAPTYLTELFHSYTPNANLRSANKCLLNEPKYKLVTFGGKATSVIGAKLWNGLPVELRRCKSLERFKEMLKTYMFQLIYK